MMHRINVLKRVCVVVGVVVRIPIAIVRAVVAVVVGTLRRVLAPGAILASFKAPFAKYAFAA